MAILIRCAEHHRADQLTTPALLLEPHKTRYRVGVAMATPYDLKSTHPVGADAHIGPFPTTRRSDETFSLSLIPIFPDL